MVSLKKSGHFFIWEKITKEFLDYYINSTEQPKHQDGETDRRQPLFKN